MLFLLHDLQHFILKIGIGVIAGNLALTLLWNVTTYFPYEILPHNNINTTAMTKNYTYDVTAVSKGDSNTLNLLCDFPKKSTIFLYPECKSELGSHPK